ncbi:hypothetical protein [Streptacidiphilus sp. PAMC 29251]
MGSSRKARAAPSAAPVVLHTRVSPSSRRDSAPMLPPRARSRASSARRRSAASPAAISSTATPTPTVPATPTVSTGSSAASSVLKRSSSVLSGLLRTMLRCCCRALPVGPVSSPASSVRAAGIRWAGSEPGASGYHQ